MERLIKFEDACVISRVIGKGEHDEEITKEVYNDRCNYQQGVQAYQGYSQRNSLVVLPGDFRIRENDLAIVTQSNGVRKECQVKTVRNIKLPITGERRTRLEMKYDKDITDYDD